MDDQDKIESQKKYEELLKLNLRVLRELNDYGKVDFIQNILWPEITQEMYDYAKSIEDYESCDMLKYYLQNT